MGGDVWVQSKAGVGSVFHFTIQVYQGYQGYQVYQVYQGYQDYSLLCVFVRDHLTISYIYISLSQNNPDNPDNPDNPI